MYKEDLALNTLEWLICHKTETNQPAVLNTTLSVGSYLW